MIQILISILYDNSNLCMPCPFYSFWRFQIVIYTGNSLAMRQSRPDHFTYFYYIIFIFLLYFDQTYSNYLHSVFFSIGYFYLRISFSVYFVSFLRLIAYKEFDYSAPSLTLNFKIEARETQVTLTSLSLHKISKTS